IAETVILEANDGVALMDDAAALKKRAAQATKWLAAQHAKRRFVPLAPLTVEPGADDDAQMHHVAHGAGLVGDRLPRIPDARAEAPSAVLSSHKTPATWLAKDHVECAKCDEPITCHNPAFLSEAFADPARKIALVKIAYVGTDTCWEPEAQLHAIAW